MRVIWRLALACLLALAVPLQGVAARVWPACAVAMAPASGVGVVPARGHDASLMSATAPTSNPCHPGMALATEASPDDGVTRPAAESSDSPSKCLPCDACSHCAAVGTVLAWGPMSTLQLPETSAQPAWPAPQPLHEPVWPQGLERPPRATLG